MEDLLNRCDVIVFFFK